MNVAVYLPREMGNSQHEQIITEGDIVHSIMTQVTWYLTIV